MCRVVTNPLSPYEGNVIRGKNNQSKIIEVLIMKFQYPTKNGRRVRGPLAPKPVNLPIDYTLLPKPQADRLYSWGVHLFIATNVTGRYSFGSIFTIGGGGSYSFYFREGNILVDVHNGGVSSVGSCDLKEWEEAYLKAYNEKYGTDFLTSRQV